MMSSKLHLLALTPLIIIVLWVSAWNISIHHSHHMYQPHQIFHTKSEINGYDISKNISDNEAYKNVKQAVIPSAKMTNALICIGITFRPTNEALKLLAYNNTINMYRQLGKVKAFLVVTENAPEVELDIWKAAGNRLDTILNATTTNSHGTPFLSSILHQVEKVCPKSTPFVAYVNADIMFNSDLERTLETLSEWANIDGKRVMAVGRRSNHDLSRSLSHKDIRNVKSELEISGALDYFIMTRSLISWDEMPSFVVGRPAYDNILVDWAYHQSILVDVTRTVFALHQTTGDGNRAGHSEGNPDKQFNLQLPGVSSESYDHGSTDTSPYKTIWLDESHTIQGLLNSDGVQMWPRETQEIQATSGALFSMQKSRVFSSKGGVADEFKNAFPIDSFPVGLKWAVITSIFPPSNLIKTMIKASEWCTVVVTDKKSPTEADYFEQLELKSSPNCFVYLTIEKQLRLGYAITELVPFNSFGRKNIGYVFAVHHGAKVIYDTDDDNEIGDADLLKFWASLEPWATVPHWYTTGSNPYSVLGGVDLLWPRGLPLDQVKDETASEFSRLTDPPPKQQLCIIQSLADKEPDVDAIYRLTNPNYPLFFTPDTRHSASTTKDFQMAPFNAQATLFFDDAFHTMLLPVTVHGRVSDIWRGYMAQATRRKHCTLAFTTPWVIQVRNSHNYLADFDAEIPLYLQTPFLVEHLKKAEYNSYTDAVIDAYEHGILEELDVHLATAWHNDLARARLSAEALLQSEPGSRGVLFRHLLILMGRGAHLKQWMSNVLDTPGLSHVDLVIGIFDHTVESLECPASSERIRCVNVAGTTWTTGRNILAKESFKREMELGRRYSFWTFSDADIILKCIGDDNCLRSYDMYLADLPAEVWAATILGDGQWEAQNAAMVELQAFDAAWNSMRREAVPVLLPYRTEQDSNSWWSSQAIFWNRLQCLAPLYAVAPLFVFYNNPEHNEYPRNQRNIAEEQKIADQMMGRLSSILTKAPTEYNDQLRQDRIRPLPLIIESKLPNDETFRKCNSEFSSEFYSFILK